MGFGFGWDGSDGWGVVTTLLCRVERVTGSGGAAGRVVADGSKPPLVMSTLLGFPLLPCSLGFLWMNSGGAVACLSAEKKWDGVALCCAACEWGSEGDEVLCWGEWLGCAACEVAVRNREGNA